MKRRDRLKLKLLKIMAGVLVTVLFTYADKEKDTTKEE